MSSTHAFRAHDVRGSTRANGFSEASPSPNIRELGPRSTAMDAPLTSPSRSDPTGASHLHTSIRDAYGDLKVTVTLSSWQSPCGPTTPSPSPPLHSIYGLWSCMYDDVEDFQVASPLAPCLDGDIFGVGKRPVQREVEIDGCVRLVFVEE